MRSERFAPGVSRIGEAEIRAVLQAQYTEVDEDLVAQIAQAAGPLDDAIEGLLQVGDLLVDDAVRRGGQMTAVERTSFEDVLGRVIAQTDALLALRAALLRGRALDEEDLHLVKLAQVTADAVRSLAG
ncbi:hypothetical protein [Burkholderia vietnamiensis]|uniref:hypothetical protein n=1 Tax=Burkholderia cepacia complex TaxID=87882 RepID=UPI00158B2B70|nr:hypothetical protein [Burkholderia vietnamiensis]MCA8197325.1 hypothetical protein [Burkholderia vietnamiensis]MCA8228221.1 hypothetical protein [Burkholderia vietnamiensis]UEC05613.1 hypothetical protein LK462_34825 [Burkholderia vietnamiensis]